jgi:hypothetical protein
MQQESGTVEFSSSVQCYLHTCQSLWQHNASNRLQEAGCRLFRLSATRMNLAGEPKQNQLQWSGLATTCSVQTIRGFKPSSCGLRTWHVQVQSQAVDARITCSSTQHEGPRSELSKLTWCSSPSAAASTGGLGE